MTTYPSTEYYDIVDKTIPFEESKSIQMKRFNDGTVHVLLVDDSDGTITKLALYEDGKWACYNNFTYNNLFKLFKEHTKLTPTLCRFLRPSYTIYPIRHVRNSINTACKKLSVNAKIVHKSILRYI